MPQIIGALRGVLSLDSAAFDTGVTRAVASMSRMERRMAQVARNLTATGRTMSLAVSAPMAAAAAAAVRSSLKTVDAQAKMAQSLGTTVKSMQVLDRAADLAGVSVEGLETGTKDLTRRLSQAEAIGGPVAAALGKIHLSGAALLKLPLDQRIAEINSALERFVPAAERAAVAGQLFGEEGSLAISRIDSTALRRAAADVERFGIAVSEVQADQIERTNDAISRLGLISRGIANQLTAALAPTLEKIADKAAQVGDWFNALSDRGKRLAVAGAAIAAGIGPAALAIGALVTVVSAVSAPIAAAVAGLGLLAAGAAAVTAAVKGASKADEIHQRVMDNVTVAMGDQIRASAWLAATLHNGQAMTLQVVEAKIAEAKARRAVVEQLIEERREAELAALGYYGVLEQIESMRATLDALRTPGDDLEQMPAHLRASYEETEAALSLLLAKQQELLRSVRDKNELTAEEQEHLAQIEANLAELQRRQEVFNGAKAQTVTLSERLSYTVDKVSRNLRLAWQNASGLAGGLGQATAQAAALSGFLAGLPGDLAAAQASVAGLRAGVSVLAQGGSEAAANAEQYRAQLEASLPPMAAMQDGMADFVRAGVEAKVEIFAQEQALRTEYQKRISALTRTGGAAKKAAKTAIDGLRAEIAERRKLLGMTDDQRRKYEAVLAVQKRLGREAERASKAEIEALAGKLVALENAENALSRVADLQRQWSENITRTAFEGGNMGDVIEGVLKDIGFQIAHTKFVLPVVARITDVLGLDQLIAGSGGGGALGGGGGSGGGGLLGGLLGGNGLLGGLSKGFGIGLGNLFGAGGGLGTYFSGLGAQLGAVFADGFSVSALGGLLGMAGPLAIGVALLSKALSRKYAGTALRGTLGSEGFDGTQFDFFRGGVLAGDKAKYKAVPAEIQSLLDNAMKGVTTGLKGMALSLGLATGALADFTDAEFTLWTNGKDAAQIQAELGEKIGAASDKMAALVLGTTRFTRDGESATDTLTRLSTSLTATNTIMDTLEHRLFRVSLRGADAASSLADAFGGLEAMQAATAAYWRGFYSEQERVDTKLRQLRARFADLGLAMPTSRAGFRDLVEGINTTTDGGRKLYAELVSLSGALDEVLPQVASFTLSMSGLVDRIGGEIEAQIGTATDLARASAQAATEWYRAAGSLRDLVRSIDGTALGGGTARQQMAANRAAFDAAVSAARGGDVEAAKSVPALARAVLDGARATAATGEDYRYAAAQVRAQVSLLAGASDLQGANEEVLKSLYEKQIKVLTNLGAFLQLEGLTGAQIDKLDGSLRKLVRNWDGTVGQFKGALKGLEKAIVEAEAFSYDDMVARLDTTIALSAKSPEWLKHLVQKAGGDIRTTLDFVIRRNDLTPDMRWLAVNSLSEHVKSLRFVVKRDLPAREKRLALATGGALRKSLRFVVARDLPEDMKRIALAGDSELSRVVNVALGRAQSDPRALRLALGNIRDHAVTVTASLSPRIGDRVRRLVFRRSGSFAVMVEAALTRLSGAARRVLLQRQGRYTATIGANLAADMPRWKSILLANASTAAIRGITLAAAFPDSLSKADRKLLRKDSTNALRTITAGLRTGKFTDADWQFLRQLEKADSPVRTILGRVDLSGLSGRQKTLLDAITGVTSGKITIAGGVEIDPGKTFSTWYADTTRARISTPMTRLGRMLDRLRVAVAADTKDRKVARLNAKMLTLQAGIEGRRGAGADVVGRIEALEASTGARLARAEGDAVLTARPDGTIAYDADWITGTEAAVAAFKSAFYGKTGLEAAIFDVNRNIAGIAGIRDQIRKLRRTIKKLDGTPAFDNGGLHAGGLRIVGESGPELEATGPSRIWSAGETRTMLAGGGNAREMDALRRDVSVLGQWMSQIEGHTHETKSVLRRLDAIGIKTRT